MYRMDVDGVAAHNDREIFEGEVVIQDENCGYWQLKSKGKGQYPNPLYVKLCMEIWSRYPQFLIICDAWADSEEFGNRDQEIIESGLIPRKYDMPLALS